MKTFSRQVAVVTGASSGVGRAVALALAKEGASLALVGRDEQTLRAVARQAGPARRMKCYVADLLCDEDLAQLGRRLGKDFGGIDLLVHSAGVFSMGRVESASLAEFDRQYRCNVRAPFALTQLLLPSLVRRRGQIVFLNSTAGVSAQAGVSQYAATKHALKAVADSLRHEVNSQGVRVLSVFLGRTATPMQAAICKMEGQPYDARRFIQPADVARAVLDTLALPRSAEIVDFTMRPMKKPPVA